MFKTACDTMKKAILVSAVLLVTGALLEIIPQIITFESTLPALFIYGGLIAIGLGITIILGTFIAIMIPSVNRHLDSCQH